MYIQTFHLYLPQQMEKKVQDCNSPLECCLYFTANSLSRYINELAEEAFASTGLAPSYSYLMMLVTDKPGQSQNELSHQMNLKPSTMTRFVEKLKQRELVYTSQEGRTVYVHPTEKGKEFRPLIDQALKRLYDMYCKILGEDFAVKLTADIHSANLKLEK